jgi:hypothetical protein
MGMIAKWGARLGNEGLMMEERGQEGGRGGSLNGFFQGFGHSIREEVTYQSEWDPSLSYIIS